MSNLSDKNSGGGEYIIYRSRLHWITYAAPLLMILTGVSVFVHAVTALDSHDKAIVPLLLILGSVVLAIIGILFLVSSLISFLMAEFIITNRNVILKKGIIKRVKVVRPLHQVDDVVINQSLMGRIFGYGSLIVSCGNNFTDEMIYAKDPFSMVAYPEEFSRKVYEQKNAVMSQSSN